MPPSFHSEFPVGHPDRTRILLIYDHYGWVLGKWARTIQTLFGAEFDFVLASFYLWNTNEAFFARLVEQMDAVHLLLPHPFAQFREIATDQFFITTIHHWVAWGDVYQQAISRSDHIVAVASVWKQCLIERGVPEQAITVVRNGVDDRFFTPTVPLLMPSGKLTVGFFAKMSSNEADRKGTRHLRRLIEHMAAQGMAHLVRFVIAGPGWRDFAAEMAAKGVEIVHPEFLPEEAMPAVFRSLDVYLVLSDVEGGPATIAEAMASRCLVLTTRVGAALDIIEDGWTGHFIDATDTAAVAARLAGLARDRSGAAPVVERAYGVAATRLRLASTFAPLAPLYRRAAGQGPLAARTALDVNALNASIAHLSPDPL